MDPVTCFGWPYTHVTGSVQVKAGQGVMHSVVVNGLTTAGDITIYDSLDGSGNVIAVLHLDPTTSVSVQPITFLYDLKFVAGLYFDYDQSIAADLTVMHN